MSGGVPTINRDRGGNTNTGDSGPEVIISIRRQAARGMEQRPASDGNKESVADAPTPPASKKTAPSKPARASDKGNKSAAEATPPFAKEPITGDGWTRAREAARKMHRSK